MCFVYHQIWTNAIDASRRMILDHNNRQYSVALMIRDTLVASESAHLNSRDCCHHGFFGRCWHIDRDIAKSKKYLKVNCQPTSMIDSTRMDLNKARAKTSRKTNMQWRFS